MTNYELFLFCFKHAMTHEVSKDFNMNDPETIAGLCETKEQKHKTGYCNVVGDAGGETKFGIAKKFNSDLDIKLLTLEQAKLRYLDRYWTPSKCTAMITPIHLSYFDTVINSGYPQAAKLLQRALGVTDDGSIGNVTLSTLNACKDVTGLIEAYSKARLNYLDAIVAHNPTQNKFLTGWKARVNEVKTANLNLIKQG